MWSILKQFLIFCHLNVIGAFKSMQEQIWDRHRSLSNDLPKKHGKTLVITGGGRGIGFEAVKKLLASGFHVILGVRNPQLVADKLSKFSGSFEVCQLDLNSLDSVRNFAREVLAKNIPIHVLINNAGIMFGPRKESLDGFEQQLATNHLGHFLLIHLLLPKLRQSGSKDECVRVINVSSAAHAGGSWIDWDDFQSKNFYSPQGAYCISKAAQIMTAFYMNEKCKTLENCNITFNAVHPGVVKTELYAHAKWITWLAGLLMKSPEQGGDTLVHAALAPELEGKGGLYLENSHIATPSSFTRNLEHQIKMWKRSCDACQIENYFQ